MALYSTSLAKQAISRRINPTARLRAWISISYSIPHYTKFVQGNAEKLPFSDGEFRCVVLAEALNYVADPVKVLIEAKRVSAESIIFVVSLEAMWDPKNMPFQTLEKAAQAHGITIEEQELQDSQGKLSALPRKNWPIFILRDFTHGILFSNYLMTVGFVITANSCSIMDLCSRWAWLIGVCNKNA